MKQGLDFLVPWAQTSEDAGLAADGGPDDRLGEGAGGELASAQPFKGNATLPQEEAMPWGKLLVSLVLAWLAWDLNHHLTAVETSISPLTELPIWARLAYGTIGKEAAVIAALMFAFVLMAGAARQVLGRR